MRSLRFPVSLFWPAALEEGSVCRNSALMCILSRFRRSLAFRLVFGEVLSLVIHKSAKLAVRGRRCGGTGPSPAALSACGQCPFRPSSVRPTRALTRLVCRRQESLAKRAGARPASRLSVCLYCLTDKAMDHKINTVPPGDRQLHHCRPFCRLQRRMEDTAGRRAVAALSRQELALTSTYSPLVGVGGAKRTLERVLKTDEKWWVWVRRLAPGQELSAVV